MNARISFSRAILLSLFAAALSACMIFGAYFLGAAQLIANDLQSIVKVRICGNGITDADEVCDDGTAFNVGGYSSSTAFRTCEADCLSFGPYCGDNILQARFTEACDDGNNTDGDLCTFDCQEEPPVPTRASGAPPRGPIPPLSLPPGVIPATNETKVILRGKAYPNTIVNILLDGKAYAKVNTDSNADFNYSVTSITPGTASFSFNAQDSKGVSSITVTNVFEVMQSAVTTVANIFLPPTIAVYPDVVPAGGLILLSGQTVPNAQVKTDLRVATSTLIADADSTGKWAAQYNVAGLTKGEHTAKAKFIISDVIQSGFGRSVSFNIGNVQTSGSCGKPDMNGDEKINLVDFSIFLLSWDTSDAPADFNCDQRVNLADFSIMLFQWTG